MLGRRALPSGRRAPRSGPRSAQTGHRWEWDRIATVPLTGCINIEDLRRAARRRLPRAVFDYIDGGAEREFTLRENCRAFEMVTFRPRSAVATQECRLQTTVLGTPLALPLLLAPVGSSRLFYPRGEAVAAEGAGAAGIGYILSTLSGCRLEEVSTASKGPVLYQLYLVGGRDVAIARHRPGARCRFLGACRHHRY